jgi:hypothetical protein
MLHRAKAQDGRRGSGDYDIVCAIEGNRAVLPIDLAIVHRDQISYGIDRILGIGIDLEADGLSGCCQVYQQSGVGNAAVYHHDLTGGATFGADKSSDHIVELSRDIIDCDYSIQRGGVVWIDYGIPGGAVHGIDRNGYVICAAQQTVADCEGQDLAANPVLCGSEGNAQTVDLDLDITVSSTERVRGSLS